MQGGHIIVVDATSLLINMQEDSDTQSQQSQNESQATSSRQPLGGSAGWYVKGVFHTALYN